MGGEKGGKERGREGMGDPLTTITLAKFK